MKSRYGIRAAFLAELRRRDENCVYCHVPMTDRIGKGPQDNYATIEHLYPPADDPTWVAWCCNACNASHKRPLREWFESAYCLQRGINEKTVAPIIQAFLASGLKEGDQLWLDGSQHRFLETAPWSEPTPDKRQSVLRSRLRPMQVKAFDVVVRAIKRRGDKTEFGVLEVGTYGRYYGFMYWFDGEALHRIPFDANENAAVGGAS